MLVLVNSVVGTETQMQHQPGASCIEFMGLLSTLISSS